MAPRISVVISQFERRQGQRADFEEQLITRLLFENGLDATLIADLKSIATDTTDHLCLEGIKGDFVLATWESPQYVAEHLARLKIGGFSIVPMDGSPSLPSPDGSHGKRVYYLDLKSENQLDRVISQIKKLVESKNTAVYNIGGISLLSKPIAPQAGDVTAKNLPEVAILGNIQRTESKPTPVNTPGSNIPGSSMPAHSPLEAQDDDEFPQLDQLLDDLDSFKL